MNPALGHLCIDLCVLHPNPQPEYMSLQEKMGYVHVPKVRNSEFERTPFKPHTTKAVHHMN